MRPAAVLSLISDLYEQIQAQQARIAELQENLEQAVEERFPPDAGDKRPVDAPLEGPEVASAMARGN